MLRCGSLQATKYKYSMASKDGADLFLVDSSSKNVGAKAPRDYYGVDAQAIWKHSFGKTEIRAEYWRGTQPGTATTTANPGFLPTAPTYIRNFDAAFFYFLQNIINRKYELMMKYDWYDPNKKVSSGQIGKTGTNMTLSDIKFSTLGIGITRYFSGNLKFLVYYDIVRNEKTQLLGFEKDVEDNIFTFRLQLRF